MNRIFFKAFLFITAMTITAACSSSLNQDESGKSGKDMTTKTTSVTEEPEFDIVTDLGTIRVRLYKETPLHRDNFVKLVSEGFYDGVLFHRVIDGFMIQTGDPLTKDPSKADLYGTGGPGYTIPAEFNRALTHKKGALAAARRGDAANPKKESSGSQFYIVQDAENCSQLDGAYTVFGETVEGLDIIDKIAAVRTDRRDRPVQDIHIRYIKPAGQVNEAGVNGSQEVSGTGDAAARQDENPADAK